MGIRVAAVGIGQDGVVPESRRPAVGMDALTVWCRRWLRLTPAETTTDTGSVLPIVPELRRRAEVMDWLYS
jgi:hypothetical protein